MKPITINKFQEKVKDLLKKSQTFSFPQGRMGPLVVFSREAEDKAFWFPTVTLTQLDIALTCLRKLTIALGDSQWLWDFDIVASKRSCTEEFLRAIVDIISRQFKERRYDSVLFLVKERKFSVHPIPTFTSPGSVIGYIPFLWLSTGTLRMDWWKLEEFYSEITRLDLNRT